MYEDTIATHTHSPGAIPLVGAPIVLCDQDHEGIHIAALNLSYDIGKVTGTKSDLSSSSDLKSHSKYAIIAGSIERSTFIQNLISAELLDVSGIQGKWECYMTKLINSSIEGCEKALVICGSDKRGTIFGIYSLSRQIGVSPWYFWADVPVRKSDEIYAVDTVTRNGPPSVKYRGIFINDEAPALTSWVRSKFALKYNSEFYVHVFELLLRLKANFLWPAMWRGYPHPGNSFFMDDPQNQEKASRYGIVVGTSHHEPMQRAMNEWFNHPNNMPEGSWSWLKEQEKITRYFYEGAKRAKPFESLITMGMRGDGDLEMEADDPQSVVDDVLRTQRKIIRDVYGREDAVPQLIALYKEVLEYFESGLEIPDDLTLLFTDDNFGSIRRLPTVGERKRKGGAGIYYHLEYVGAPRSYKWLNSNALAKVYQQLSLAHYRGAHQVWIFNVGDIKPLEIPLTYVLDMAWNIENFFTNVIHTFFASFFSRMFQGEVASKCAALQLQYDKLMAMRKHEHIDPETFSLINYNEADEVMQRWQRLLESAVALQEDIPAKSRPSYFQLLLHPIKASYLHTSLQITRARNSLYAQQRRTSTNEYFQKAIELLNQGYDLEEEFHSILNGKWKGIMCQPKLGYGQTWHAPSRDMISGLCYVQTRQDSNPIAGNIGVAVEGHAGVRPGVINEESDQTHPSRRDLVPGLTLPLATPFDAKQTGNRWFELYSRSTKKLCWNIDSPVPWVCVEPSSGKIDPKLPDHDVRIEVSIDWGSAPESFHDEVLLVLESDACDYEHIHVPIANRKIPEDFKGHVESDGHIAIPANKYLHTDKPAIYASIDPYLGREMSGAVYFYSHPHEPQGERFRLLQYPFYTFTPSARAIMSLYFTLSLDTDPTAPMVYSFSIDDQPEDSHELVQKPNKAGELPPDWMDSVMDCVWVRKHEVDLSRTGHHCINVRLQVGERNLALEKIVVDVGGVRESYLGPPESYYADPPRK